MNLFPFFRSVIDQDAAAVVLCDTEHRIVYMNPAAAKRYAAYGGGDLVGKSLLDCHSAASNEQITRILAWFRADGTHNCVHTFYNAKENKDVYMIALRDEDGTLIGYYEKHAYRDRDTEPFYRCT